MICSDSSPLEVQVKADSGYMEKVASLQLPNIMLTPEVDLIPHDIRRLLQHNDKDRSEPPQCFVGYECRCTSEGSVWSLG